MAPEDVRDALINCADADVLISIIDVLQEPVGSGKVGCVAGSESRCGDREEGAWCEPVTRPAGGTVRAPKHRQSQRPAAVLPSPHVRRVPFGINSSEGVRKRPR